MTLFTEIAFIVSIAVLAGFLAHLLRQPVIIGFIAAGFFIGFLERIELSAELIENLASIGVALLLFFVGLEMKFEESRHVTIPALLVGLGQILFTFGVGFFIVSALGFSQIASFYIALALTFSSTIVVIKLVSEKEDLSSLYGRVVIGILLVQDFVAIFALLFISGLQGGEAFGPTFASTLAKGAGLILLTMLLSRVFPRILRAIGKSQEMLYLFGIAWALGAAALTSAIGLSIEIGGLLAGLALSSSAEHFRIGARLRPLRDFFIILFFVALGIQALEGGADIAVLPVIVLTLFVLIGNPLIILTIMGLLGYRSRTSFLASTAVAQISEFSLILVVLGHRIGDLDASDVSLVTLVGMLTIFASSYLIVYNHRIYEALKPLAKRFEFRKNLIDELPPETAFVNHIVLIGVHRMGESIVRALRRKNLKFVAIDFDPLVVASLKENKVPVVYGDIADTDVQARVGLNRARVVISTLPDFELNRSLIVEAGAGKRKAKMILTAENEWQARELYREGADYVLIPHFIGGQELSGVISRDSAFGNLKKLRARDLKILGE